MRSAIPWPDSSADRFAYMPRHGLPSRSFQSTQVLAAGVLPSLLPCLSLEFTQRLQDDAYSADRHGIGAVKALRAFNEFGLGRQGKARDGGLRVGPRLGGRRGNRQGEDIVSNYCHAVPPKSSVMSVAEYGDGCSGAITGSLFAAARKTRCWFTRSMTSSSRSLKYASVVVM